MKINRVEVNRKGFRSIGVPRLFVHKNSSFEIGSGFKMNNLISSNPIGRNYKCMFVVRSNSFLKIGANVGFSGTIIVCTKSIVVGNNVKIGGNVCIYDTDFHSLNTIDRLNPVKDKANTVSKDIIIGNNVFIGAHSTILKGVNIGDNSIIGASSLVTKNIPSNEVWAGNPVRFIKKVNVI